MKIRVHLFAYLAKYAPEGVKDFTIELKPGASVEDIIKYLGIPPTEGKIIIVNGRHSGEDTPLNENDEVVFMTPVEGG
ncbi:MAG: MoaD/ThiS family protein [Candidatus Schekmanbacteria bacterium]|nr:MoaD/ThiS family protein [Candidatus Schekmanbacteria bacterium]